MSNNNKLLQSLVYTVLKSQNISLTNQQLRKRQVNYIIVLQLYCIGHLKLHENITGCFVATSAGI